MTAQTDEIDDIILRNMSTAELVKLARIKRNGQIKEQNKANARWDAWADSIPLYRIEAAVSHYSYHTDEENAAERLAAVERRVKREKLH